MKQAFSIEDTLNGKKIARMGNREKAAIYRGLIRRFIRENVEGVSAGEVAETLDIAPDTVRRHLDHLVTTREVYRKDYSQRNTVYFPNARLSHPYHRSTIDLETQRFRVSLIENLKGEFVYIQELQETPTAGYTVVGGIIIRVDNVRKLQKALDELLEKVGDQE